MDEFYGESRTPKKSASSSLIPFSTSPNQLHEVTSSANVTNMFDQTKISPVRGRSVKEYDEQLSALKKENFNLKLRIYFLEERMGSTFRVEDKENVVRRNIELQVDVQALKLEIAKKDEYLCEAVQAMEIQDNESKRIAKEKDQLITELNKKVEQLERDLNEKVDTNNKLCQENEKLTIQSTETFQQVLGIQMDKRNFLKELESIKEQNSQLRVQLTEEKEQNFLLENENREMECLQLRNLNLENELKKKTEKINELVVELEAKGHLVSSCNLRIRTLEDALTAKNSDIKYKDDELITRDRTLQEQLSEIEELRRLVEENQALCNKEQRQVENLKTAVMARDNTIADLESKHEKCKSVIRNLESKLDSLMLENKRFQDELQALKYRRKRIKDHSQSDDALTPRKYINCKYSEDSNTMESSYEQQDKSSQADSFLNNSNNNNTNDDDDDDDDTRRNKYIKLEEDYRKACLLISNLLEQKKTLQQKSDTMLAFLEDMKRKRKQTSSLKSASNNNNNNNNNTPPTRLSPETENAMEEYMENKNIEDNSLLDATTLEWTKQVEDLMEIIQEKEEELQQFEHTIMDKEKCIGELEMENCNLKMELGNINKRLDELTNERQKGIDDRNKRIEQLESEIRKQTSNLQGIVNKELWDKNREIEKLQNRFTNKVKQKDEEICELEKQITAKDIQLKVLKEKISDLGVQVNLPSSLLANLSFVSHEQHQQQQQTQQQQQQQHQQQQQYQYDSTGKTDELSKIKDKLRFSNDECKYLHQVVEELRQQLRNTPERDIDMKLNQMKTEHFKLEMELEKSEKLKKESIQLCSLLMGRLEELAHFLDSLLKHKSVLGVLGNKQRLAIKQAVDQSLDLSKSLSITINNKNNSGDINTTTTTTTTTTDNNNVVVVVDDSNDDDDDDDDDVANNHSLTQLSSISELLNNITTNSNINNTTTISSDTFHNYTHHQYQQQQQSHLNHYRGDGLQNDIVNEQSQIISILRVQIDTMKKEIELRDIELNKQTTLINQNLISSASSPSPLPVPLPLPLPSTSNNSLQNDNDLVNCIIDLEEKQKQRDPKTITATSSSSIFVTNKLAPVAYKSDSIGSESEAWSEPDRSVSQARIGLDTEILKTSPNTTTTTTTNSFIQNRLNKSKKMTVCSTEDEVIIIENNSTTTNNNNNNNKKLFNQSISQDSRQTIVTLQEKLYTTENKLKEKENEILLLKTALIEMENKSLALKLEMSKEIASLKNEKFDIERLLKETEEKCTDNSFTIQLQQERDNAINHIEQINIQMDKLKQQLETNGDNWKMQMELFENEKLNEIKLIKTKYETEWIPKSEMNKYITEFDVVCNEMVNVKEMLKQAETKISNLEASETELKQKLTEAEDVYRHKLIALKRELNESTLRASQTALERTRISNEKIHLESELRKYTMAEATKINEYEMRHKELLNAKNNLEKQMSQCEQQKTLLQLKVSELEIANAELYNRLIKIQVNDHVWIPGTSIVSASPPKISDLVSNFKYFGTTKPITTTISSSSLMPTPSSSSTSAPLPLPLPPPPSPPSSSSLSATTARTMNLLCQRNDISTTGYVSEDNNHLLTATTTFTNGEKHLMNRTTQIPNTINWFSQNICSSSNNNNSTSNNNSNNNENHNNNNNNINLNHNPIEAVNIRTYINTSPDLGIESDQGRFSSLEIANATTITAPVTASAITTTQTIPITRPLLQTLELTTSMNNLLSATPLDNMGNYCNITAHKELETENTELKRTVSKLENSMEKAKQELSKINRNKIQVEKAVCKQIHKTSKVLRQARANLDSGSENEKRT